MPIVQPQFQISTIPFLPIEGLNMIWSSESVLEITAGACQNRSNANVILTSNIGATSAQPSIFVDITKSGAAGLDQGTVAADTFYNVYVIGDSTLNLISEGLFSISSNNPVLPKGYDMFRRIGTVLTDSIGQIIKFYQTGLDKSRTIWYDEPIEVLGTGTDAVYTEIDMGVAPTMAVPPFASRAIFQAEITPTGPGDAAFFRVLGSASAAMAIISGSVAAVPQEIQFQMPLTSNSIEYFVVGTLTLLVAGYEDVIV